MRMLLSVNLERGREYLWHKVTVTVVGLLQVKVKARGRVLTLPRGSQGAVAGTARTARSAPVTEQTS